MFGFLKKIFGTAQGRTIKKYSLIVEEINAIEEGYQSLSYAQILDKVQELKKRYREGANLDDLLPEAYAVVKNICRKLYGTEIHVSGYDQNWDMIPYDVQLIGAIAMHNGTISEMQTGEGKTLTAALPLFLNALTERPVHLVTVNDYLAKRDCEWIGTIFRKLGMTVAPLVNGVPADERMEVYKADIVYGTASEFGFDYLRDNSMASSAEDQVQRGHYFAIIDEIDSILIDEARTPLIISGPTSESTQMYDQLKGSVYQLVRYQREYCNRVASEARKALDALGLMKDDGERKKLSKQEEAQKNEAFKKLWMVTKGTPRNKVLKKVRENPDFRAELDKWETYYTSDQNKQEKQETLRDLLIIVDERGNEYELTDKGIQTWATYSSEEEAGNDFVMYDLGHEYALIDNENDLTEEEKIDKKVAIREADAKRKERAHNLRQLFRAHLLMEKDVDYIVQDDKVVIIDENTGRPQPGRRFSDGLHQSIEAKESLKIQGETQTYATITLQNYFRMYDKIAGMTGTAMTEASEFRQIYNLDVIEIPTYCSCKRNDSDDEVYMTEREKYIAILKEIKQENEKGRPILIGTESVEISEKLSRILKQNKLIHTILNAKNHDREAEIIADAGKKGAITLATNMAGRGTDIKLSDDVKALGGLYVMGTTRHHSRRIDRQLRGRSGRLGDPGASKFFVSFEDSLMRLFASPRLTSLLQRFRPPEGEPISASVLNRSIETAQKRIEQRNYTIRKHTLEYDDVMNRQRQEIYSFRNELLHSDEPIAMAKDLIESLCSAASADYFEEKDENGVWNALALREWLLAHFPVSFEEADFDDDQLELIDIEKLIIDRIMGTFDKKIAHQEQTLYQLHPMVDTEERAREAVGTIVRNLIMRKIDALWQEHLLNIDHLRSDVNLRVVAQKDPLLEFKHEAFGLFDRFSHKLKQEIAEDLFKFEMISPEERKIRETISHLQMSKNKSFVPQPHQTDAFTNSSEPPPKPEPITAEQRAGRNEPCPCGSGKKYKKCCGAKAATEL